MRAKTRETAGGMVAAGEMARFRRDLLTWFEAYRRDLPWRRTRDPYAIWISEIMLQQTRVAAAVPYYERFLTRFPNVRALAEAPEPELLATWAGLGYYHRARNLQKAARAICQNGAFPASYADIRKLAGIGDYTAAAVASIGFDLPHAVVDGNVLRVLSRVLDDATDIGSSRGRKHFTELAEQLLDRERPGAFNQALMELGATVCLPKKPQCLVCPVAPHCRARSNGRQNELPVKLGAQRNVEERRVVYWITAKGKVLAWQRAADMRLMPGFWELPERAQLPDVEPGETLGTFRHGITFHNYRFEVKAAAVPPDTGTCEWIEITDLERLPVSTIFKKAKRVVEKPNRLKKS